MERIGEDVLRSVSGRSAGFGGSGKRVTRRVAGKVPVANKAIDGADVGRFGAARIPRIVPLAGRRIGTNRARVVDLAQRGNVIMRPRNGTDEGEVGRIAVAVDRKVSGSANDTRRIASSAAIPGFRRNGGRSRRSRGSDSRDRSGGLCSELRQFRGSGRLGRGDGRGLSSGNFAARRHDMLPLGNPGLQTGCERRMPWQTYEARFRGIVQGILPSNTEIGIRARVQVAAPKTVRELLSKKYADRNTYVCITW